jgi:hypothetical protein
MVTCWPRDFPGGGTHSQKLAQRITEASRWQIRNKEFCSWRISSSF